MLSANIPNPVCDSRIAKSSTELNGSIPFLYTSSWPSQMTQSTPFNPEYIDHRV
jgi:hypothetical protein